MSEPKSKRGRPAKEGRRVEFLLSLDAAAALDRIRARVDGTATDAVETALLRYDQYARWEDAQRAAEKIP